MLSYSDPSSSSSAGIRRALIAFAIFATVAGCKIGGCAAGVLGDIVGETGDSYCDRRFVTGTNEPAPFCQEVIDTVAQSQFEDDCREKHGAQSDHGKCPRDHIIGGCKLLKKNDDNSEVYDWYYDVTNLEDDARDAEVQDSGIPIGDDEDPDANAPPPIFSDVQHTKDDVKALCADPTRYEDGADYVDP